MHLSPESQRVLQKPWGATGQLKNRCRTVSQGWGCAVLYGGCYLTLTALWKCELRNKWHVLVYQILRNTWMCGWVYLMCVAGRDSYWRERKSSLWRSWCFCFSPSSGSEGLSFSSSRSSVCRGINNLSKAWPHNTVYKWEKHVFTIQTVCISGHIKRGYQPNQAMQIIFAYTKQKLKMTAFFLSFGVYCAVLWPT